MFHVYLLTGRFISLFHSQWVEWQLKHITYVQAFKTHKAVKTGS